MTVRPLDPVGSVRPGLWLAILVGAAVVVWNGVFDILVTRGVKEYLYRSAEYALGRGPAVTMDVIMAETVADAAITASLWALFVGAAGLAAVALAVRRKRERTASTR
jgi:hypothetical protein